MKHILVFFLSWLLVGSGIIVAQEDDELSWPIIERCLPEAMPPHSDWTFTGEILMSGWAGIHGINAESETPYVLDWGGGLLSPNGEWVLKQPKQFSFEKNDSGFGTIGWQNYSYSDITVVNIRTQERITFPWSARLRISSGPYPLGPAGPIWLDDSHFVTFWGQAGLEYRVADLEDGTIVQWDGIEMDDNEYSISPDQTRAIAYSRLYDLSDNSVVTEDLVGANYDRSAPLWTKDSEIFVDLPHAEDGVNRDLSFFDRDGNLIDVAITNLGLNEIFLDVWSPRGRYLRFMATNFNSSARAGLVTYLLDVEEKVIYDLCLYNPTNGWAWSPDDSQFATILGYGQSPIVVVDMEKWQPYIIGYHAGRVNHWVE